MKLDEIWQYQTSTQVVCTDTLGGAIAPALCPLDQASAL